MCIPAEICEFLVKEVSVALPWTMSLRLSVHTLLIRFNAMLIDVRVCVLYGIGLLPGWSTRSCLLEWVVECM